jgi:diguanylate cyclase (GGDEF)-like protein
MKRILIVDDDRETVDALTQYLAHEGYSVQGAGDVESALHRVRAWKPQLVLLDVNLPGASGLSLVPKIRAASDEYVAVILVSGKMAPEDVAEGLAAGADDFLPKPFRTHELLSRIRAMMRLKTLEDSLRRANRRADELSSTDELTGLLTLKAIVKAGDEELARARRSRSPVSIALLDLDGFHQANAKGGYLFGNFVLQEAGRRLRESLGEGGQLARVGADEFLALLAATSEAGARAVAERMRASVATAVFRDDRHSLALTARVAAATASPDAPEATCAELFVSASHELRRVD